jgi:hypothetical protein
MERWDTLRELEYTLKNSQLPLIKPVLGYGMKQEGLKHWDTVKELEYELNPLSSANQTSII